MYGSNRVDGALGESVFHDVPVGSATWDVPRSSLYGLVRTLLIPQRPLTLIDLTGWAHKQLRIEGRQLVEVDPSEYPTTALWAERFHHEPTNPDGIYWRSRQFDKAHGFMLFGDRVPENELAVVLDETIPLWMGDGFDELCAAADAANITISR